MNQKEIIERLAKPFSSKEIEWKVQVTTQDKARGMAVPYIDNRAIQKRLDETAGIFGWRNAFDKWHDNSQLCGISIYSDEHKEWITKYDGADNSDVEPIKGGLSDSMKRAAVLWGIGRYLYELDGVWVEIEQRGKGYAIKQDQYSRLETEYNNSIAKLFGTAPANPNPVSGSPSNTDKKSPSAPENTDSGKQAITEYKVLRVKPAGTTSQFTELVNNSTGEVITAYIRKDDYVKENVVLSEVDIEKKTSDKGSYNMISKYKIASAA